MDIMNCQIFMTLPLLQIQLALAASGLGTSLSLSLSLSLSVYLSISPSLSSGCWLAVYPCSWICGRPISPSRPLSLQNPHAAKRISRLISSCVIPIPRHSATSIAYEFCRGHVREQRTLRNLEQCPWAQSATTHSWPGHSAPRCSTGWNRRTRR